MAGLIGIPRAAAESAAARAARHTGKIARQRALLESGPVQRIGLTTIAFALTTLYPPVWLAVAATAVNLATKLWGPRLMRGLDPEARPRDHAITCAQIFVPEFTDPRMAGRVWQQDANHAKAFALSMVTITSVHLTTLRATHLPHGTASFGGGAVAVPEASLACRAVTDGEVTLRMADFDLQADLAATVALFDVQAQVCGGGIALHLHPDLPRFIRKNRQRQCLTALVSNAQRPAGGAKASVHAGLGRASGQAPDLRRAGHVLANPSATHTRTPRGLIATSPLPRAGWTCRAAAGHAVPDGQRRGRE